VICGRRERVRDALDEVASAVLIVVDRVPEIIGWHHLSLAKLARARTEHLIGSEVATLDDAQGVEQLRPEHFRAATIIRKCCERLHHRHLRIVRAEVCFEPPQCGDHGCGHPVLSLDAREDGLILSDQPWALLEAIWPQQTVRKLEEILCEDSLPTVSTYGHFVVGHERLGYRYCALRNPLSRSFLLELLEPPLEVVRIATNDGSGGSRPDHRQHRCSCTSPTPVMKSRRNCPAPWARIWESTRH